MNENNKNKIIIVGCIAVIVIGIIACAFIVMKPSKKNEGVPNTCDKISLKYHPTSLYTEGHEIELNNSDIKKLNDILDNLKLSDPVEGATENIYEIEYCNDSYIIGNTTTIGKNQYNVLVTDGYDKLKSFLDDKLKEENRVYLYNVKNGMTYENLALTDEEKNNIKKYWTEQEKKIEYIDLAMLTKYVLVIDDDVITTDESHKYVTYKDGHVALDDRIELILDKYNTITEISDDIVQYSINNNMNYYDSKYKERGVYFDTLKQPNSPVTYYISSGEKTSGGYSIKIEKVTYDNDGTTIVHIKDSKPEPGVSTTMALTYPVCSITFNSFPEKVKFITDENEELKILGAN